MLLKFNTEMVRFILWKTLSHQVITDTDLTFKNEVHISYFILFIEDESILWLHIELGWFQTKANFKEEVFIIDLIRLTPWNEECSKPEDYIIEQVMQKDVVFDLFWTLT